MAQEFEVIQFNKGDYRDSNGNYWCDMVLKDIGEPVRIAVKDPTQFSSGMNIYGHIEDKVGQSGKPYQRFYREKRPDDGSITYVEGGSREKKVWKPESGKKEWKSDEEFWGEKDGVIRAEWSIGQAVQAVGALPGDSEAHAAYFDNVEFAANHFNAMIDRVKASGVPVDVEPESGYKKAKAVAASLPKSEPELDLSDEPISLADIPF